MVFIMSQIVLRSAWLIFINASAGTISWCPLCPPSPKNWGGLCPPCPPASCTHGQVVAVFMIHGACSGSPQSCDMPHALISNRRIYDIWPVRSTNDQHNIYSSCSSCHPSAVYIIHAVSSTMIAMESSSSKNGMQHESPRTLAS